MRRKLSPETEWVAPLVELDKAADVVGLPREWVCCPFCGEFCWRWPPHGFSPCPLVTGAAETQGLKLDAERMMAVRAGVHMEEMGKAMGRFMEEQGLVDDEEEDTNE